MTEVDALLDRLGYRNSSAFLAAGSGKLEAAPSFGHVFRRAVKEPCHLQGVYTLRADPESAAALRVPVLYVCRADTEDAGDEVHRLVWNQDVVPLLLVVSARGYRLYSGFRFRREGGETTDGVLRPLSAFNTAADLAKTLDADAIDSGRCWREWGKYIRPEGRIDWRLLDNLRKLDKWLQGTGLKPRVAHALIGKYVFLRYLRDRDILSERKLAAWKVEPETVFGRQATKAGLAKVSEHLEAWLNGEVFPLSLQGPNAPLQEHVRRVAATFHGDEIVGDDTWQLHLDFQCYNFKYIPIETLSVIYEQFLHAPDAQGASKGRRAGAYYTPLPVVDLMLTELERRSPIVRGKRAFDAACGSGAFLVQYYRRLIENEFPATGPRKPTPTQLKELLTEHVFGVDRDPDACGVAQLSLLLTLLDYVEEPDLGQSPRFKLPALGNRNIICQDFSAADSAPLRSLQAAPFDVVMGNPPWKSLNPKNLDPDDKFMWQWMRRLQADPDCPVGGNQVAQAFTWEIRNHYVKPDGEVALLLPAMTLFEDRSRGFRAAFFRRNQVHAVANFSNLAEVLFAGRSRVPAAAFFFRPAPNDASTRPTENAVEVFSPFVANQETTRPVQESERGKCWSLIINASEIRDIPLPDVADGTGLPWKLAMWGTHRDQRLLKRLEKQFPSLKRLEREKLLLASQGLELRPEQKDPTGEPVEPVAEVVGKKRLDVKPLERLRDVFAFPKNATQKVVSPELGFVREGRGELPLSVCRPPHVIVSAARTFAVFSNQYLVVPPRQIGIVSPKGDRNFLKALSLFLSSDFAFYHQFLTTTEFGVKRDRATLRALRRMPIPVAELPESQLKDWCLLHSRLAQLQPRPLREPPQEQPPKTLFDESEQSDLEPGQPDRDGLLRELNNLVYEALGLDDRERALVRDLVHVKLELNDGRCGKPAVASPSTEQLRVYARRLKSELDAFIEGVAECWHNLSVVHDGESGMVEVDVVDDGKAAKKVLIFEADEVGAKQLARTRERLSQQQSQWVYFNRNLRIYEGRRTYLFKPLQRFHWTESQAMQDAGEIIAETLAAQGGEP